MHSIRHYVIKKGRCHGARHGKTEEQKEYHMAWNAWKRCCKRVDSHGEHFTGIHDRFLRDQVYRESQLLIGWTEQKCKEMDELAKQNHTYHLSTVEFKRYQGQWYLTLNKSRKKWAYATSTRLSSCSLSQKPSSSWARWGNCRNQHLHSNIGDGTLPQAIPGGTRPKVGGAHDFLKVTSDLIQLVSFTVDADPL